MIPLSQAEIPQETQMDRRLFSLILPSSPAAKDLPPTAFNYDMEKKGLAIIFNHYEYSKNNLIRIPTREGTHFDMDRMKKCLKKLNFNVDAYNDLKLEDIENVMKGVAKLKRSDISCLIIVVMTHGDPGILQASDYHYNVDTLWKDLTGDKCPGLIGVPKLYFIQACRGDKVDGGYSMSDYGDNKKITFTMPSMADFLQMYSTYEDHSAWREADGTWFIQSLCEVLEEEAENYDLLQLLTFVNRKVALEYESYTTDPTTNKMKQIPQVVSMLTKVLRFNTVAGLRKHPYKNTQV